MYVCVRASTSSGGPTTALVISIIIISSNGSSIGRGLEETGIIEQTAKAEFERGSQKFALVSNLIKLLEI